jgi:hypothetical protein
VDLKPHASGSLLLLLLLLLHTISGFDPLMLLQPDVIPG